jgi:hypothetical protein
VVKTFFHSEFSSAREDVQGGHGKMFFPPFLEGLKRLIKGEVLWPRTE